ncbi:alpha/beta hydrolase family protein [Alkalicaulis satelles]|nr:prolyl oligopeptidase family serine peptidase [Alkalicaulis satelles]
MNLLRALTAALTVLAFCASAQASVPVTRLAQMFGEDADLMLPALSRSGDRLAFLTRSQGRTLLAVMSLEGDPDTRSMDVSGNKIRDLYWIDDRFVMATISTYSGNVQVAGQGRNLFDQWLSDTEYFTLFAVDTRTMQSVQMLGREPSLLPQSSLSRVSGVRDGRVLMPAFRLGGGGGRPMLESTLFSVDPSSGTGRVFVTERQRSAETPIMNWIADAQGNAIARLRFDNANDRSTLELSEGNRWRAHPHWDNQSPAGSVAGVDGDGSGFYSLRWSGGFRTLARYPANGGEPHTALSAPPGRDLSGVIIDPVTRSPVGGTYVDGAPRQVFIDPDLAAIHDLVAARAPGLIINVSSWNAARTRALVHIATPGEPGTYLLVERTSGEIAPIGDVRPAVADEELVAPRRLITYQTRDGVTLEAVITDPPGARPDESRALVVLPHGGPAAQDDVGFDYIAGFIAALGYRVVQPNFRGSTGYGRAFERAGWTEWGGRMQDDVTDALTHLVETGAADPARVCIAGASYGGYAALAGAAFTPDLYRCAAAIAPVSDLWVFAGDIGARSSRRSRQRDYWRNSIGDPNRERAMLEARSPARFAAQVQAPVLLIHPVEDTVVPVSQSELMQRALAGAGKDVRLVRLDGEDHWLSLPETRVAMLEELGAFLTAHLGAP